MPVTGHHRGKPTRIGSLARRTAPWPTRCHRFRRSCAAPTLGCQVTSCPPL